NRPVTDSAPPPAPATLDTSVRTRPIERRRHDRANDDTPRGHRVARLPRPVRRGHAWVRQCPRTRPRTGDPSDPRTATERIPALRPRLAVGEGSFPRHHGRRLLPLLCQPVRPVPVEPAAF